MYEIWNVDGVSYEKKLSDDSILNEILNFQEEHQNISYDMMLEEEIRNICTINIKSLTSMLKSKARHYLWEYVVSCTPLLTFCEQRFGIRYNTSLRVKWCLQHMTRFPQCHNEKCKDILLYKVDTLGVFEDYPLFCRNHSLCMNQSSYHKSHVANSLMQHYGVNVPAKSPLVLKRMQDTCMQLYGVDNVFKLPEVTAASHSPEVIAKRLETLSANMMEQHGVPYYVMSDDFKMKTCTASGTSKEEQEMVQFIRENCKYDVVVGSFQVLDCKRQLDVYIDELKLAFEFNGTYYPKVINNCKYL